MSKILLRYFCSTLLGADIGCVVATFQNHDLVGGLCLSVNVLIAASLFYSGRAALL